MWRSDTPQHRGARGTCFGYRCAYVPLWDVAPSCDMELDSYGHVTRRSRLAA